ncbi:MAG: hypothetical protein ACXWLG_04320 [Myxococcaceae bacterium]
MDGAPLRGRLEPAARVDPRVAPATDAELLVTIVGVEATTGQFVHARWSYLDDEILFGHRYVDMVTELPDGRIRVDLRHFHDVVPDVTVPPQ